MKLEDFLLKAEGDDSRRLPDGRFAATWDTLGKVWNIGPGLTHGVTKNTVWTQEQLKAAEEKEFAETRAAVANLVHVPLAENQRTALESLVYNIGVAGFARSSVLRYVNAKNFAAVPNAFRLWNRAGGKVCQGLINRREAEIRLWLHPDDVPVPSDLRTPQKAFIATQETTMEKIGAFFVMLLANQQVQSLFRSALKIGGTALVLKAGGDPGSIDTIVGGLVALIGAFGSVVTHSPTASPSPTSA